MSFDGSERAVDEVERLAVAPTDVNDRVSETDAGPRPLGRLRRRREPESFPARASTEFGMGAGRLGTTFGRAMLAWPGRDPLRRSDRR